jgi:hypothetical protein
MRSRLNPKDPVAARLRAAQQAREQRAARRVGVHDRDHESSLSAALAQPAVRAAAQGSGSRVAASKLHRAHNNPSGPTVPDHRRRHAAHGPPRPTRRDRPRHGSYTPRRRTPTTDPGSPAGRRPRLTMTRSSSSNIAPYIRATPVNVYIALASGYGRPRSRPRVRGGRELPRRRSYPVSAGACRCRLSSTVVAVRACSWCSVPARARPFVSEWLARSRSKGDHDWDAPAEVTVMGRRPARSRSCGLTGPPQRVSGGRVVVATGATWSPRHPLPIALGSTPSWRLSCPVPQLAAGRCGSSAWPLAVVHHPACPPARVGSAPRDRAIRPRLHLRSSLRTGSLARRRSRHPPGRRVGPAGAR